MLSSSLLYGNEKQQFGHIALIAGVDEAGRGPVAGPVVVAAVILDKTKPIVGINDSKKLSAKKRQKLYSEIITNSVAYSIVEVSHQRIDEINILQAVLEGMHRAVLNLSLIPDLCLIDGNKAPSGLDIDCVTCIKGDGNYASIAAASILAKVHRDSLMANLDSLYPGYGFTKHKGYPTAQHLKALSELGPCPVHRQSYAPVKCLLKNQL
jgi:ribonuclease HII